MHVETIVVIFFINYVFPDSFNLDTISPIRPTKLFMLHQYIIPPIDTSIGSTTSPPTSQSFTNNQL